MTKIQQHYYSGGFRVMIDGIPCRITIEPTKHMLECLRNQWSKTGPTVRYSETTYLPAGV